MISYVMPTRNRAAVLAHTLQRLGTLTPHDAEVIVVDNASDHAPAVPLELQNGLAVRAIQLESNVGAAARNTGVQFSDPSSQWIVMLDDDSYPCDAEFVRRLAAVPSDVGAVMADIHLPRLNRREDGGLPEVFIGCGVAIRRDAFWAAGGYDAAFNYYVEEYDLAAKLMLCGYRAAFDIDWRVEHLKDASNRDMNMILGRLIRNNGWVMQRYAPADLRRTELRNLRQRYRRIAAKEHATAGFTQGLLELRRTLRKQVRHEMSQEMFDRFRGMAAAREALQASFRQAPFRTATLVHEGKNANVIREALVELGVRDVSDGEVRVIATLSPGPMLDAAAREMGALVPWTAAARPAAVARRLAA